LPSLRSTKEFMTFPSAERLLLIIPASFNHSPPAEVSLALSDPAKSIIWNQDYLSIQSPSFIDLLSIIVVKTEWDQDDSLFIEVHPTWRFQVPLFISSYISDVDEIVSSVKPST